MFGSINSRYQVLDDPSLLERYKKTGNLEILGVLYHRYMHLVFGVALKHLKDPEDSKDAVMQIFEKLVDKLREHQVDNFKPWLYSVTRNHCLELIRRKSRFQNLEGTLMESDDFMHLNGEENDSYKTDLTMALSRLSEHQQRCIKLFFYEKRSYQEIAEETGYELKKVKSYIQNGKRNLKNLLDK